MIRIFSMEGNIGSGKSTFLEYLSTHLHIPGWTIRILTEPVQEWTEYKDRAGTNILEKFYEDQASYAFTFQMMAYISRMAQLRQAIRECGDRPTIILTERSVFTDRHVFAKMLSVDEKIDEIQYAIYLRWFDEFSRDCCLGGLLWMNTCSEKCYTRVIQRARQGESIPLEYLSRVHQAHLDWIQDVKEKNTCHILELDGSQDNDIENALYSNWLIHVKSFLERVVPCRITV